MEQLKLSLACLKKDVAAKCEEKMAEANILRDDNSDIILLNYSLFKNKGKLKQDFDFKTVEDKKIILVFNEKLKVNVLSNILFRKNILGLVRLNQFDKIKEIVDNFDISSNKIFIKSGGDRFLIKGLVDDFSKIIEKNNEDPLLKLLSEYESIAVPLRAGTNQKEGRKFSYNLNCKVDEAKLLIVGLFFTLLEKDKIIVLKSESLRLKYGLYIVPNLKTSGKGDLDVFIKTNDLVINSSKKISDEVIAKLQKMIEN